MKMHEKVARMNESVDRLKKSKDQPKLPKFFGWEIDGSDIQAFALAVLKAGGSDRVKLHMGLKEDGSLDGWFEVGGGVFNVIFTCPPVCPD